MKPFFKYTGGKTREMKKISPYLPPTAKRVIEPFCGSCAVAFHAELPAVVGDLDEDVINLLQAVQGPDFSALMTLVESTNNGIGEANIKHLEKLYYELRDDYFQVTDPVMKAYRFLVLRQLCFSGMTRFNVKTGKSNVPYGWYPEFKTRLSVEHHNLLQNWDIKLCSWENTIKNAQLGDWVFFDPPYLERNSAYEVDSAAGTSLRFHEEIKAAVKNLSEQNIPWLLIHSDCEFYRDAYAGDRIVHEAAFYSQNFKGAAVKNARVGHLYISPRG